MGTTKHVYGVSDEVRFKPDCSASGTARSDISLVASYDIILFNKQITKVLIRLHLSADWSAPLLFANHCRQVFWLDYGSYHTCV